MTILRRAIGPVIGPAIGPAMGLTILALAIPAAAAAQDVHMELRQVAPDIYVVQHPAGSSNALFAVTDEGVVVFDADIRTGDQVLAAIRRTTDQPIRYMFISHPAGDHATGAWHFREDDPVLISTARQAQSLAAEELDEFTARKESDDPAFASYRDAGLVQPDMTFTGSFTLHFGGLTFELAEEGAVHSYSDVTLYIPERRVFALGDLYKSELHNGPGDTVYETFGAGKDWLAIVGSILARDIDVETYVPGHGVMHVGRGDAELEELRAYFLAMRTEVSRLIAAGKSEAEVLAEFQTPAPFDGLGQVDRMQRFLPYYYRQLKAEAAQ